MNWKYFFPVAFEEEYQDKVEFLFHLNVMAQKELRPVYQPQRKNHYEKEAQSFFPQVPTTKRYIYLKASFFFSDETNASIDPNPTVWLLNLYSLPCAGKKEIFP